MKNFYKQKSTTTYLPSGSNSINRNSTALLSSSLFKSFLFIFLSFFLVFLRNVQAQTISTVAGDGTTNTTGNGIGFTQGVAVDANGNIYVATGNTHKIRKITPAGVHSDFAGTGTANFSGDGGPALSATLNDPSDLYIAGNSLYVADLVNRRIRKIDLSTNIITTVAGDGTTNTTGNGIGFTAGVAVDATGNIYVATGNTHKIRKITPAGVHSDFAGTGTANFTGDGGSAASATLNNPVDVFVRGDSLYVADGNNRRIRKINLITNTISTVAGDGTTNITGSAIGYAQGIAVDEIGNLIVATGNGNIVRKVTPSGIYSTVAGTGTANFSGDGGLATAAQLNSPSDVYIYSTSVYIADVVNRRIRQVLNAASVIPSNITDYFRSVVSGNWNSTSTWESSTDNVTYHPATLTPDFNANLITILNLDTVTVTANVTIDQTTINSGGVVTVNSGDTLFINDGAGFDIAVNGTLTIQSGGSMKIKSTSAGTASVGTSTGTITGSVIVDRYVPSRRAWRLITAPLSSANTIYQAWQNGGVSTAGIGTYITGPAGGNGLDNGKNYSLDSFNTATQLLVPVINTNIGLSGTSGSAANKGYFLFVRGDRTPANLTPPNSNITTLSAKGALQTGTQTFAASNLVNNFSLIGNPYASPVDFDKLGRAFVARRFYAWDPSLNTVGGYVLVDDGDNNGVYTVTPPSSQTSIIQSSQAFFVQTLSTGAAAVTFSESNKSTVETNAGFRTGDGSSEVLRTNLYLKDAGGTTTLADGVLAEFNAGFSAKTDMEDGAKMTNINENLAMQRDGSLLAIERRPMADVSDTLFLNLTNTTARGYEFEFVPSAFSGLENAWFEDAYLKTSTPVSLSSTTKVAFDITADKASANASRFRIIFKTSGTLPVEFTGINAVQKNAGILVGWFISTESNIDHYDVERSENGQLFTKIASVTAAGKASYSSFDATPLAGNNFYRIKAVLKSGSVKYSAVVKVKLGNDKGDITLYPNPVTNKTVTLQLNNEPKGTYLVELFNRLGQKLLSRTIEHVGGSAAQTINLGASVSKGVYQLKVSNGESETTLPVLCE